MLKRVPPVEGHTEAEEEEQAAAMEPQVTESPADSSPDQVEPLALQKPEAKRA